MDVAICISSLQAYCTAAIILNRCTHLLRLDDYLPTHTSFHAQSAQIQSVEVARIRGSVNRSDDFDCNFYPLSDRLEVRWIRIASMMLQGTSLPPVELVQVGEDYFVVDGHHRVSVARMLEATTIDAVIAARYD